MGEKEGNGAVIFQPFNKKNLIGIATEILECVSANKAFRVNQDKDNINENIFSIAWFYSYGRQMPSHIIYNFVPFTPLRMAVKRELFCSSS